MRYGIIDPRSPLCPELLSFLEALDPSLSKALTSPRAREALASLSTLLTDQATERAALRADNDRLQDLATVAEMEHQLSLDRALAERDALRDVIGSVGNGVLATDTGGRVVFANAAAAALLGSTPEDLRESPFFERFVAAEARLDPASRAADTAPCRRERVKITRADGATLWAAMVVAPILREDRVVGLVVDFHGRLDMCAVVEEPMVEVVVEWPEQAEVRPVDGKTDAAEDLDIEHLELLRHLPSESGGSVLDEIVELYLRDVSARLVTLHDALARGDRDVARRIAHAIRGASGNLGAKSVAAMAERIERDETQADIALASLRHAFTRAEYQLRAFAYRQTH